MLPVAARGRCSSDTADTTRMSRGVYLSNTLHFKIRLQNPNFQALFK